MSTVIEGAAEPRGVGAGRGIDWWREGWALFMKNPVLWGVLGLILMVVMVVLSAIPLLGAIAAAVLMPVFLGSWMLAARKVEGGGELEVGDLFVCFKQHFNPLVVLGALLLAAGVVISIVAWTLGAGAVMGLFAGGMHGSMGGMMAAMGTGLVAVLLMMVLGMVIGMVFWFAPGLVVFRGVPPVDALKASFAASLKNIVPFVLYSVVYFVAAIVASLLFGLGWLVLVPVLLLTVYASYRDVFGA